MEEQNVGEIREGGEHREGQRQADQNEECGFGARDPDSKSIKILCQISYLVVNSERIPLRLGMRVGWLLSLLLFNLILEVLASGVRQENQM